MVQAQSALSGRVTPGWRRLVASGLALVLVLTGCGPGAAEPQVAAPAAAVTTPTATTEPPSPPPPVQLEATEVGADKADVASDDDALAAGEAAQPVAEPGPVFTHKMMKPTGENPFASLGYECNVCTFEQWLAIEPPEGWSKGPPQVLVADQGEMRSRPSFEGVASAVDFVDEVPGNEFELIVKNLDAEILEGGDGAGFIVRATVQRDTSLEFVAGRRVHELADPDGNVFVLFAWGVDPLDVQVPDFDDPDALGDFSVPDGWTYTNRIIDEDVVLDSTDTTTVLAIRTDTTSTWELR